MCICEEIGRQKSQNCTFTHAVDFSLLLFSQLPPNCCKHRDIPKSSPHRYPTHTLSHNHHLPMCICEDIGGQTPQKCSFIHTQSTFRCCYALNFRQTAANIQISGNQVHTGTPHTFCLTTTTIPCVFVKKWEVKTRKNARLYTRSRPKLLGNVSCVPYGYEGNPTCTTTLYGDRPMSIIRTITYVH
jgi:hypothetical protein